MATRVDTLQADEQAMVDRAVNETVSSFAKDKDPFAVDLELDRLTHELQLRASRSSEFLTGYYSLHADVENLRTLVRLKAQPGPDVGGQPERDAAFLGGGRLALHNLLAALPEPWPAVVDLLTRAAPFGSGDEAFSEYLAQGSAAVTDRRSYGRLERLGREMELRYLRQTRYATFGHEPLVTFYLLRENEVRNLRLLYSAKVAGLAIEETSDLVAYVD